MKFLVQPTDPPQPKTKNVRKVSLLLTGIILIMVVAQLFTFEKFPIVIAAMGLPIDEAGAQILASAIVILEVFSLPFLLGMRLSHAMRVMSMLAGWMVILIWLIIAILIDKDAAESGFFGATLTFPAGWWMVFFVLGLDILTGWVAWGMWPFTIRKKNKVVD